MEPLNASAAPVLVSNGDRLRQLMNEFNRRVEPLADPLLTDYGVHAWLTRSREEAYSDWLAWIMCQLDASELFDVFSIDDPDAEAALMKRCRLPQPAREVCTEWGHDGHEGRLDIELREPKRFLLHVEVKLSCPEDADLLKQRGYARWSLRRGVPRGHIHRRLVALCGQEGEYDGGFRLVTWNHVAVSFRRLALEWLKPEERNPVFVVKAAQALSFAGAIEQNLLEFSAAVARKAWRGQSVSLPSAVVKHLEFALERNDHAASS